MKKILKVVLVILLIILLKLSSVFIVNEVIIINYNKKKYNTSLVKYLSFIPS